MVLKYKFLQAPISVEELTTFAQAGELSQKLRFYLSASKQNPEAVRRVLNQEVNVNAATLERALNNPVGGLLLEQISRAVHPPSEGETLQALRSALVLSAQGDHKISLIEALQNYPSAEVVVEGEQLIRAYRQVDELAERFHGVLEDFQIF
ncbi:MAG: alpha/beta hydrolase [Microcystaceae cyanobacterium]